MIREIMAKNVQVLMRSRSAMLLLVGAPLLLFFFAGIAFDNSAQYDLTIGYLPATPTEFQLIFLEDLSGAGYKILPYPVLDECRADVKRGVLHTCMEFSPDFRKDNPKNEISFHVDYSRLNIMDAVLHALRSRIAVQQEELGLEISRKLVQTLEEIRAISGNNKFTMVDLTTQNQEIAKKSQNVRQQISRLTVPVDMAALEEIEIGNETEFASWIELLNSLGEDAVKEFNILEKKIREELQKTALKESDKIVILELLDETDERVDKLRDKIHLSSNMPQKKLGEIQFILRSVVEVLKLSREAVLEQESIRNNANMELNSIQDELDQNLVNLVKLQNAFNGIENLVTGMSVFPAESIVNPVKTIMKPIASSESKLNYIFPTLLGLVLMYGGILLASLLIMMHRKSPAALRNKLTPTKAWEFMASHFMTVQLVLWVQIIAVFLLTLFFMGSSILASALSVFVVLLLVSTLFVCTGIIIGDLTNTEEGAVLAGVFVSTLLLLTSGAILPLESMPKMVAQAMSANPLLLSIEGIKQAVLFQTPFMEILSHIRFLGIYCIALMLIIFLWHNSKLRGWLKIKKSREF